MTMMVKSVAIGVHLLREDIEPLAAAVPVADLFVSALAVDDDQPLGDRELLLRVAEIRAGLLQRATFVAIRYGFAFRSPAEAEAKVASFVTRWKPLLVENRSRVEMTLKVAAAQWRERPDRHQFQSGAGYLRALQEAKSAASIDPQFRAEVEERIVPLCVRHQWIVRDNTSLELAGLIERESLGAVTAAGEALKEACPSVPFLLSAPWPLEVFANADHE